jgi:hypothetical protein
MLAGLSHPNVVRFYGVCTDLTSRTTGRLQVCDSSCLYFAANASFVATFFGHQARNKARRIHGET